MENSSMTARVSAFSRAYHSTDFTVLGQSPFETAPEALHAIPVTAVFLGGERL